MCELVREMEDRKVEIGKSGKNAFATMVKLARLVSRGILSMKDKEIKVPREISVDERRGVQSIVLAAVSVVLIWVRLTDFDPRKRVQMARNCDQP